MKWPALFLLAFAPIYSHEIKVDLKNPVFKDGVLFTNDGGVINNQDIRIQARNIQYFHRTENGEMVQRIEADGDLMIQYKGRVFVGQELKFNLIEKTGILYEGQTDASIWYVGSDQIFLKSDGSYEASNAFITACENKISSWDLFAKTVNVIKNESFEAKSVRFRLFQSPIFYLPALRLNLKKSTSTLLDYYMNWNKGPKVGFRYELLSWRDLSLFGRLEYRWGRGWGGAFETEYLPDSNISFVTRSYAGTDRLFNAVDSDFRYRLQGALHSHTQTGKTQTTLSWDKYSDVRMPGDFKSEDFEVDTAMKTILYVHHTGQNFISSLKVRPRVNSFESIQQDLPTLFLSTRPTEIKKTKIISSNFIKASYLDFNYSDQLVTSLKDFQSPRLEAYENLYRPFHFGPLTVTPSLEGRFILYGTSPDHDAKYLAQLGYGARMNLHGKKQFENYKHVIEPYLEYKASTRPTVLPDEHYIFSIQDGYHKLQQIEIGIRNILFANKRPNKEPNFTADLYANAFLSDPATHRVVPRGYLNLVWQHPSLYFSLKSGYNFRHDVLDFSKARLKWTLNQNVALSVEGRYRSKYDWRKGDHNNFVLDVTRSEKELLNSPLSDRRVTVLTNAFFRLNPFWELKFESHHGFYRLFKNHIKEEPYNEFQIHLYTWISSAWKFHIFYGYTLNNHFDWGVNFQFVKKGF